MANTVIDRTGSPPGLWLLALMYVVYVLNNTATSTLNWTTPISYLTGTTNDISPLLRFQWYEPVCYKLDDSDFPSESRELRGRFVGIAKHCGHAMTIKILTDDTQKIIYRSNVRSALDKKALNLRLDPLNINLLKKSPKIIKGRDVANGENRNMPIVDPIDLIGRTFLKEPDENGEMHRARIVECIKEHKNNIANDKLNIKFRCSVNNNEYEEIIAYNDLLDHINKAGNDEDQVLWKFRRITGHEGPLTADSSRSLYNVMIEWENGEITSEPLSTIASDNPVTCAIYARENNLLELPGWKRFRSIAKRQKKMFRMANQAKLRSYRTTPKYQYGFEVPRDYDHAVRIDKQNGNTKWQDATSLEMKQLDVQYADFKKTQKELIK